MTSVVLFLEAFHVPVTLGATEAERAHPQELILNVSLSLHSVPSAASSDALEDTLNVDDVAAVLREVGAAYRGHLLEGLCEQWSLALLQFPRVRDVTLKVIKQEGAICRYRWGLTWYKSSH